MSQVDQVDGAPDGDQSLTVSPVDQESQRVPPSPDSQLSASTAARPTAGPDPRLPPQLRRKQQRARFESPVAAPAAAAAAAASRSGHQGSKRSTTTASSNRSRSASSFDSGNNDDTDGFLAKMKGVFKNSNLSSKLKGNGYWILNVLRAGNIIALVADLAAYVVMMAFSIINRRAWGFDILTYAMLFVFTSFLVYSETGLTRRYIARHWPIFAADYHGFGWLGMLMIFIGVFVLGNLNEEAFLQENIPMAIWRVILAAGILSITFGVLAILSTWIFGDSKNRITARSVREKGSLATADALEGGGSGGGGGQYEYQDSYSSRSYHDKSSHHDEEPQSTASRWAGKAKRLTSHFTRGDRPVISHPRPQTPPPMPAESSSSNHFHHHHQQRRGSTGSDDMTVYNQEQQRTSPIVPDLPRPPTARHPMFDRSSKYSEASHLPRFYGETNGRPNQI